ncbi:hypothetical protein Tco_0146982, partial [Tanacetum coccineum]
MAEPLHPDHVIDFPMNDPTPELKDSVMEIEENHIEDMEEDPEEDLDIDINEDEEDESKTPPLRIDPIMLSGYQITTSDFLPWIPLTQPSTYEVGGPSSAILDAP